jgi:predicted GTPase
MLLKVSVGNIKWEIPIDKKLTIVRGDSGVGKSGITNAVVQGAENVNIDFPLEIVVATHVGWQALMRASENTLIIFDDMEEVETREFADILKETASRNNYCLVFSRSRLLIKDSLTLLMYCDENGLEHKTKVV